MLRIFSSRKAIFLLLLIILAFIIESKAESTTPEPENEDEDEEEDENKGDGETVKRAYLRICNPFIFKVLLHQHLFVRSCCKS